MKFLRILLLIALPNIAFAEWEKVTSTYQAIGYVDTNSIQKRGDITSINILIDYAKPPFDGNNLPYRSLKLKAEYNCATEQFRVRELTSYADNMGKGHSPYHSDETEAWQAAQPTSMQGGFWKAVCGAFKAHE